MGRVRAPVNIIRYCLRRAARRAAEIRAAIECQSSSRPVSAKSGGEYRRTGEPGREIEWLARLKINVPQHEQDGGLVGGKVTPGHTRVFQA